MWSKPMYPRGPRAYTCEYNGRIVYNGLRTHAFFCNVYKGPPCVQQILVQSKLDVSIIKENYLPRL